MRRQLERYDSDALWTLITAAGAAPGVRHRWATVGHLLAGALRADQRGRRPSRPGDLQLLLDACVADESRLPQLEDFLPNDPREEVLTRIDDVALRLFPGSVERPIADVRRALLVAEAADKALTVRLGFGVRDLITATVTFVDRAIATMASAWPTGGLVADGRVVLTALELDAAAALGDATTAAALGLSPSQERALVWATGAVADVPYEPGHPQSPFGRFIRVARHGPEAPASWMPLSHIPEILGYAVVELAQQVAAVPKVRLAFAQAAAAAARRALWSFSWKVLGPPDHMSAPIVAPGNHVQWIAMLGSGRAVLLQLVSELSVDDLPFQRPAALQVVRNAQAAPGEPIRVPLAGGSITLDPSIEVVPLLVVASAGHLAVPQLPGLPAMSLDDLRWAATSATADSDLFLFCRDLARPDRPNFFGWEAINVWEWWRNNGKTLFAGGQPPTFMMIAAHAGDAEWDRHRGLAPLERALATLALPGLADMDGVDRERTGPPVAYQWVDPQTLMPGPDRTATVEPGVHRRGDLLGWTIHLSEVPVAIVAAHPKWPRVHHKLLHDLAGAFAFGFRQIDHQWRFAHSSRSVDGYIIDLTATDRDRVPMMQLTTAGTIPAPNGRILVRATIEVCPDTLASETGSDATTVRTAMGSVVQAIATAASLPDAEAEQIATAWNAAPPTLTVQVLRTPTVRNDLAAPIKLEPALIAEVDRTVAEAVCDAGVQPGTYTGDAAKALDRDVLAPAALRVLTDRLKAFAMDDVVLAGMRELERAVAERDRQMRGLEQSARLLHLEWDPVRRYSEVQRDHLTLRRCAEVVVEAALRTQPSGERRVDRVAWAETAAAADAYLSAAMRSEHVHHQVRPTALKISDSYEIDVTYDSDPDPAKGSVGAGRVYDLDMEALQRAHSALQLRGAEGKADGPEPDETLPASMLESQDSPAPIVTPELDTALRDAFGASGSDILTTLFALAHWPLTDDDDDIIAASVDAVVEHVLNYTILGDEADGRSRVEHAVMLLTSRSQGLVTAAWKPWHVRSRRRRLLIQPLPMLSDGCLVVAPHFCLGATTAYRGHLSQGQLPWTQPAPDEPPLTTAVIATLENVRRKRNKALEGMVAGELRQHGWLVIDNVKETDPQRLNIPALSGEIDVVAGRPGQRTVWLLEVKDPADTYVVPEIRRHLDTFFVDRGSKLSYATRLRRKVDDLVPHIDAVAAMLGLPPHADGYELAASFVTRKPVPAAFVTGPFPFVSLPELFNVLTAD